MLCCHTHHLIPFRLGQTIVIAVLEIIEDGTDLFGNLDVLAESDSFAHGGGIGCFQQSLVDEHPLGESIDTPDELAGIICIDLLGSIGYSSLCRAAGIWLSLSVSTSTL